MTNIFREGVPDLRADRLRHIPIPTVDDKNCRDRQPWGGCTDPDRCGCQGKCEYDRRKEEEHNA